MKKVLFVSLWILFTVGLVLVMSFASKSHAKRVCTKLAISIDRKNADLFIKDEDVLKFLSNHGKNPVGLEFAKINTALLEKLVLSHPSVESCEVYISALGDINIAIQQRSSVSRIINLNNESFYFDSRGFLMPWSDTYTSPVLVVNGFIKENYGTLYTVNFDSYSLDSALRSPLLMDDIWQITKRIAADTFLSAQLIQVYITPERILQLIPRVGNHVIVLGDISDIDEKINKLRIFYSDGISRSGNWNDYKTIDLQFKNQIVCTKK